MPPLFVKINKWPQFTRIIWNWMSTQYSVDQINLLVYLVREDDNDMSNVELNQMIRQDKIV